MVIAVALALGCDSLNGFAGDAGSDSACAADVCVPTLVVGAESYLTALAAGDGWLYYLTDTGQIGSLSPTEAVACNVSDCTGTRSKMADVVRPRALALAPNTVYFSQLGLETYGNPDIGSIFACPRPSCSGPRTLVAGLGEPTSMDVTSSGAIVWGDSRRGSVEWCNDPCTTHHVLSPTQTGIVTVRADGETIYWMTSTEVRRAALGNTSPVESVVANRGSALGDFTVRNGRLYWTLLNDPGGIESCDVTDCAGTIRTELANVPTPKLLSVTGDTFLWTSPGDLSVRRCPLAACTPASAVHLETIPTNVALLTEDDVSWFWATSDGASIIERLAK
jgi:hypothetical protein